MRKALVRLPLVLALALSGGSSLTTLAGCGGASANEVTSAKSAHYNGDKNTLFKAMADAVKEKYPIEKGDTTNYILETVGKWYDPDGLSVSERMDDIRDVPDKSIHIAYIVALVADGNAYVIDIKPKYYRYHHNSPQPEPLKEDDISLPGYVHGKQNAFAVVIHDAMAQYEVSGAAAPAPAGAAPGSSAPPAGSAATPPAPPATAPTP